MLLHPGSNALKLIMFENLVYRILVDKYVNHIETQQMVMLYVWSCFDNCFTCFVEVLLCYNQQLSDQIMELF
jgi:hypothetical protein